MPFTNAYHGGAREPFDLGLRIDAELRTRIEDAVDYVCLGAMAQARQANGSAPPAADNARDRDEYMGRVRDFLELLRVGLVAALTDEQRRRLGSVVVAPPPNASLEGAVAAQVALAKELPDYWQRFDAIRLNAMATSPPSGGETRSLIDWILRRG